MKKILNVGGGSKSIPLPVEYQEMQHILLDIKPSDDVDLVCDARYLFSQYGMHNTFDVIYCSHNLEHYYEHEVVKVLCGFFALLKPGGSLHIIVPDIQLMLYAMARMGQCLHDVAYISQAGPIRYLDVVYGYQKGVADGNEGMAHKTAFSSLITLKMILESIDFKIKNGFVDYEKCELVVIAEK